MRIWTTDSIGRYRSNQDIGRRQSSAERRQRREMKAYLSQLSKRSKAYNKTRSQQRRAQELVAYRQVVIGQWGEDEWRNRAEYRLRKDLEYAQERLERRRKRGVAGAESKHAAEVARAYQHNAQLLAGLGPARGAASASKATGGGATAG